ncbi:MAG TPA: vitamin K epoxide reductase family protein [Solirubrobacteraceae bacterium]|nr:vitamin K epoxide reductase family protein [Solirubrobacteraceae bacterium]
MSRATALRGSAAAVATAGLGIAAYLTVVHYTGAAPACAIAHGCEVVQSSAYATLAGVPVALLGLIGYALILAGLIRDDERSRTATALVALGGAGFSLWLTYVEVFRLEAICIWCVGSAVCMVLLAGLAVARMLSAPAAPPPAAARRARRARPSARRA